MQTIASEPVVTAATISALISALLIWLRRMGWLPMDDAQFTDFMGFVVLLIPIAGALVARRFVTPLAAPKDNDGVELVRREMPE